MLPSAISTALSDEHFGTVPTETQRERVGPAGMAQVWRDTFSRVGFFCFFFLQKKNDDDFFF